MKAFVDTNILVYVHDHADPRKCHLAQSLLEQFEDSKEGVNSTQILLEFAAVAKSKLKLSGNQITSIMREYEHFECLSHDPDMIAGAVDWSEQFQISIWDAMLLVAAERARCGRLYSADFNHGQTLRGIEIGNPFV